MGIMDNMIGPGQRCWNCGGDYGLHSNDCPETDKKMRPRRFRVRNSGQHPNGSDFPWRYGVYFPLTDLAVGDMGGRGTGMPEDVEWIDAIT